MLIALNGSVNRSILRRFYWLEAQTSGIKGAYSPKSRWTYYRLCSVAGSKNNQCTSSSAAYPISLKDNFGSQSSIPRKFISSRGMFYYMSKFSYAFHIIGLFFAVCALAACLMNLCGSVVVGGSLLMLLELSFVFTTIASALITALTVRAKNAFNNDNKSAKIGKIMMGLTWASVFLLMLLCTMQFLTVCFEAVNKKHKHDSVTYGRENEKGYAARDSKRYSGRDSSESSSIDQGRVIHSGNYGSTVAGAGAGAGAGTAAPGRTGSGIGTSPGTRFIKLGEGNDYRRQNTKPLYTLRDPPLSEPTEPNYDAKNSQRKSTLRRLMGGSNNNQVDRSESRIAHKRDMPADMSSYNSYPATTPTSQNFARTGAAGQGLADDRRPVVVSSGRDEPKL